LGNKPALRVAFMNRNTLLLRACVFWICAVFLLGSASFAQTGPTFKVVAINFPGASDTSANGINNFGTIVGWYTRAGVTHGFRLSNQHFTTIDFPGAVATEVHGISNLGDMVGKFETANGKTHGFLLRQGVFRVLDFPGAHITSANGVNNALKIVGQVDNDAFTWQNGAFRRIHNASGPMKFNGISPLGWIAGELLTTTSRGFIVKGSDFDFINSPDADETPANAINGRGDVVGCTSQHTFFAFNPEAGEGTNDQPEVPPPLFGVGIPGELTSCANGVNFAQSMVGVFEDFNLHKHGYLAIRQ
jgi:probable HAF family extracellular repeat protein